MRKFNITIVIIIILVSEVLFVEVVVKVLF